MSYTINSLGGLENLSGEGWEQKRIPPLLILNLTSDDLPGLFEEYRDWMLGGERHEWRYHKDKITNEIILERR